MRKEQEEWPPGRGGESPPIYRLDSFYPLGLNSPGAEAHSPHMFSLVYLAPAVEAGKLSSIIEPNLQKANRGTDANCLPDLISKEDFLDKIQDFSFSPNFPFPGTNSK